MKADALSRCAMLLLFVALALSFSLTGNALAEDSSGKMMAAEGDKTPQWIWSAAHTKDEVPVCTCYFRKSFKLRKPGEGEIHITADNKFQLYVNGQPVGEGADWRQIEVFDISKHLRKGINTIAVEASNIDEGAAGLVARVLVKEVSGTFKSFTTDNSWKTSVRRYRNWTSPSFPESEWVAAASYGNLGQALPWGNEMVAAGQGARFQIPEGFVVERLLYDEKVGSLIAMTFDSKGNMLVSREGGHLQLLTDSDGNGTLDAMSIYCDKIKNVQGILSLGSRVFAVGDGPEGVALYRLRDSDRDGVAEEVTTIVPFRGSRGEHGAHAVRLGPDGLLYVLLGNYARVGVRPGPRSPYRNWYEGDLVKPKEEDPQGHAVGIPAPGGTIIRTDASGSFVEIVAGGLRNPYDFAFHPDGEIFTYDADMEWDIGAPWYRPTRINHVVPGGEYGWRSGWSKWPDYFVDSLPTTLDIGKGSPTGVEFYDHNIFPAEYRGALFGCDWGTGRIYCIKTKRDGASYKAENEVFISGRPLNATDIAVGPDGALYFCTGGRGTDGGVYRVRWAGEQNEEPEAQGIDLALRQPQLDADWARAQIARTRATLADTWSPDLIAAAKDSERPAAERIQALDVMRLFGPRPSDELLLSLADDPEVEVRAKAISMMFSSTSTECRDAMIRALEDDEAIIRRLACESLTRSGLPSAPERHAKMLTDDDRHVAFAARRSLEQLPVELWDEMVLAQPDIVGFCRGAAALLACRNDEDTVDRVLDKCLALIADKESPYTQLQLTGLLRVTQLALIHANPEDESAAKVGEALLARYPSENAFVDRELVRILVHLQVDGAARKFAAQLKSDIPDLEKLHVAAYAARLKVGWTTESKLTLMKYYEAAREIQGGYSVSAYVEHFARDFFSKLSLKERRHILASGERWPTSALSVLAKLPEEPDQEILKELRELDVRIKPLGADDDRFRRLRVGVIAVLGRSGDADALEYLRKIFREEPAQRDPVAMSLTQHPEGESWSYLVESLKTVRGTVAQKVLIALTTVQQRPSEPEPYRQAILLGLRLDEQGAGLAIDLLNHWEGQESSVETDYDEQLRLWQEWYATNYPDAPPAELPKDSDKDKWSYEELLTYLESDSKATANVARGEKAFTTAQCIKCHRFGNRGESLGPDLTTVSQRFQRKEILESIIYPSHIISDQYASKRVLAGGLSYVGLVGPERNGVVPMLLTDGEKVELVEEDIESISPNRTSAMPTGLLNSLSLQEVADLFAYLEQDRNEVLAKERPKYQR